MREKDATSKMRDLVLEVVEQLESQSRLSSCMQDIHRIAFPTSHTFDIVVASHRI